MCICAESSLTLSSSAARRGYVSARFAQTIDRLTPSSNRSYKRIRSGSLKKISWPTFHVASHDRQRPDSECVLSVPFFAVYTPKSIYVKPDPDTFLKDPEFVNALFLKSPRRIEALGLILILALMIWRLMERTMRLTLRASKSKVTGWKKRKTSRPTSFMMTTVFGAIFVMMTGGARRLAKRLSQRQQEYLKILQVPPEVFTTPAKH